MELGLWLLIACVVAGGVAGALLRTWSILSRVYSLETRTAVLEGISAREVKIRAANDRWKRPSKDEEVLVAALATPPPPERKVPWWQNPDLKKGAYVP